MDKDFFLKILKAFLIFVKDEGYIFIELLKKSQEAQPFCKDSKSISDFAILILWLFLVSSLLWMLYEIFKNIYLYFKLTSYRYFNHGHTTFADSPLFKQLENMYYINELFAIDFIFITFVSTAVFVIVKLYIFEKILIKDENFNFRYIKLFCYISIVLAIIYYVINYTYIIRVGKGLNSINRLFYTNINNDFINSKKICNYLDKKNDFDNNFVYGKCNDLKYNMSINRLYEYIKSVFDDISRNHLPANNMNNKQFKTLTDKNGILYKDKIISAFFTFQILKYFVDSDLIEEAKNFFSAFNMIYTPNLQIIKKKINPLLYLKIDNIIIFDNIYLFEGELKESFYENKELFEYIKFEYNKIQSQIQNMVVDIYDICSTKLMSIYVYYFSLLIVIIILISIHFFYPDLKIPFI